MRVILPFSRQDSSLWMLVQDSISAKKYNHMELQSRWIEDSHFRRTYTHTHRFSPYVLVSSQIVVDGICSTSETVRVQAQLRVVECEREIECGSEYTKQHVCKHLSQCAIGYWRQYLCSACTRGVCPRCSPSRVPFVSASSFWQALAVNDAGSVIGWEKYKYNDPVVGLRHVRACTHMNKY